MGKKAIRQRKSVTIKDIARAANVSVATVSNVLNDKETVAQSIRKNVLDIAEQLDYSRIRRAPRMVDGAMKMIGMISPDVTDPVMASIFKGMENIARIHGYITVLCDSMNNEELEKEHIENLVHRRIDGLIIQPTGKDLASASLLHKGAFPFVIVDRKISDEQASSVISDNVDGAYQAVKYLLSLGHRDIVLIAGPSSISTAGDRSYGYQKALREEGIAFREDLVVEGNFTWSGAYQGIDELARRGTRFTAVFAANDIMAFAAKVALEKNGKRVPEDVSIVGFNDILFAPAISLTTVALDPYEMGRNAMLLLLDIINRRLLPPYHIVMQPRLVIRDSCKNMGT